MKESSDDNHLVKNVLFFFQIEFLVDLSANNFIDWGRLAHKQYRNQPKGCSVNFFPTRKTTQDYLLFPELRWNL